MALESSGRCIMDFAKREEPNEVQICANCGKEGTDVTNTCNKCKSVMYCNAVCKKKHRHKHKKDCKEHLLRASEREEAELHDEKLFKQPPPMDDCPICMIRLPRLCTGKTHLNCCGKVICSGCVYAFQSRVTKEKDDVCPFCRIQAPGTDEDYIKRNEKRVKMEDPIAICDLGNHYVEGIYGLTQNHAKALKLWKRAGDLGNHTALNNIANAYLTGEGVKKDMKKARHYWELAAMAWDVEARYNLGTFEYNSRNMNRALRHYAIAVMDGDIGSLDAIKSMYLKGYVTKDDYAKALRSYQAYLDEIKSNQRDKAAVASDSFYYESN